MQTIRINDSEKVFFTSDLHFGHKNILKYCYRQYSDVDAMNEAIIKLWNDTVPPNGTVFILGDVSFKGAEETMKLVNQLNGKKILIRGNHDNHLNFKCDPIYYEVHDMLKVVIQNREVFMCHYPLLTWCGMERGSISLNGHEHGNLNGTYKPNQMDVGLDANEFKILSWKDILNKLN